MHGYRAVLKEAGLLESCNSSFDEGERPAKGSRRFEAEHPGQLWQMDVTYVYIRKIPVGHSGVLKTRGGQ